MCPDNRTAWELNEIPENMRQYFEEHEVQCGAPWERVIELGEIESKGGSVNNRRNGITDFGGSQMNCGEFTQRKHITKGWQPTCSHKAEPVPCIVLDPFGGSGTTKNVADRLGRQGVICELKMEYIEMAKKRCESNQGSLKL